jgi:hypothetical protein
MQIPTRIEERILKNAEGLLKEKTENTFENNDVSPSRNRRTDFEKH